MNIEIPWIDVALLAVLSGSVAMPFVRRPLARRGVASLASGLAFLCCSIEFFRESWPELLGGTRQVELVSRLVGQPLIGVDSLNAPLLALVSLIFFVVLSTTLASKLQRFPFGMNLLSEFLMLMALSSLDVRLLTAALIVQPIPIWLELRSRGHRGRVFALHMSVFALALVGGVALLGWSGQRAELVAPGVWLVAIAILIRNGCIPVHTWIADLFERATLGSALLYVTPMIGVYAAIRILIPISDDHVLRTIALFSLLTAFYSAGMALAQRDTRRFLAYLFLSHASLVLVGLELGTSLGLTGSLCIWISVGLALTGFGLSVRSIESRTGRLDLTYFHGLYDQVPLLAVAFLLTGLAAVGFPGTFGFVGTELIVDGATTIYPAVGTLVVFAAALNGIAILRAFFHIFAGAPYTSTFNLRARWAEKAAILMIVGLLIGLGIAPQPTVESRNHAARKLLASRSGHGATVKPGSAQVAPWPQLPRIILTVQRDNQEQTKR